MRFVIKNKIELRESPAGISWSERVSKCRLLYVGLETNSTFMSNMSNSIFQRRKLPLMLERGQIGCRILHRTDKNYCILIGRELAKLSSIFNYKINDICIKARAIKN